ncbi:MAG: hypothetical protein PHQ11_06360 [Paludibacter sp.]|nr:hypothetical protein [Paludibacter sp.]
MNENGVNYQKILSKGASALLKDYDINFYLIDANLLVEFIQPKEFVHFTPKSSKEIINLNLGEIKFDQNLGLLFETMGYKYNNGKESIQSLKDELY